MPEAQTLLIVSEGTSFGIPASIWAWRDGIWPWPACSTWPKITCWTWSAATSERSSAASIASPPSSVAPLEASAPPIFPNGVRAVPRMTVWDIEAFLSRAAGAAEEARPMLVKRSRRRARRYRLAAPCSSRSTSQPLAELDADVVAVALAEGERAARRSSPTPAAPATPRRAFKKLALIHPERPAAGARRSGSATRAELDAERLRVAAALAAKRAATVDATSIAWVVPDAGDAGEHAAALVEGTVLAGYRFDRFRSRDPEDPAAEGDRAPACWWRPTRDRDGDRGRGQRRLGRRRGREPRPRRCRTCPRTSSPRRRSPTRAEEIAAAHERV